MISSLSKKTAGTLKAVLLFTLSPLLVCALLSACSGDATGKPESKGHKDTAVPVTVGSAVKKAVPVELRVVGTVKAFSTVSVKAQVEGELLSVHFREGQKVKAGDPLFTIDPAPFEARLKQAQANLARDRAQLENAKKDMDRYASVVKKGYVSGEDYDRVRTVVATLEAAILADEALVENARLSLKYCYISSPLSGYTGELKVHRGNLVKANDNDNPLVTINQTSPIYVAFPVPEGNLPEIRKYMASGKLPVWAGAPGDRAQPARGELASIDNTVDPATGTIQLKAAFANSDARLWPGQFVNVVLKLSTQAGAIVVPSQAVQTGQDGQYVFVVKPDLSAEYRPVTVERAFADELVIAKGVSPGEKVVTDGHLRLTPGAKVKLVQGVQKGGEGSRS